MLKSQLDNMQEIIRKLSALQSKEEQEKSFSAISNKQRPLREALDYEPQLPQFAHDIQINIEGDSMSMIVELINNFLQFVKHRCEIVYEEYDTYHEILQRVIDISNEDGEVKRQLDLALADGYENGIYSGLLSGEQFIVLFKNLIIKALIDLSNMINDRIVKRREILLSQRDVIRKIYEEFLATKQ